MFLPEFHSKRTELLSSTKSNTIITHRVSSRASFLNNELIISSSVSLTEVEIEQVNQLQEQIAQLKVRLQHQEQQVQESVQQ
jgi:K+/H+ antiporter YhaU regulatory subunit KhtT